MAGYKTSIKQASPVAFITFDADNMFNPSTGMIEDTPIIDETGNGNDMLLHTDVNTVKSYLMGQTPLVERELNAGQHSIKLAPWGQTSYNQFAYEKTFLEIGNTTRLNFDSDYTVMLNYSKSQDYAIMSKTYNNVSNTYVNGGSTSTVKRYLFVKGASIACYFQFSTAAPPKLCVQYPSKLIEYSITNTSKFFDKNAHLTITHRKVTVSAGLYYMERRAYLNGELIIDENSDTLNSPPTGTNTSSWYFGGTNDIVDYATLNDRQTTPLTLDQIALFDKCLDKFTVAGLYKKSVKYSTLLANTTPSLYVPFDDRTLTAGLTLKVTPTSGGVTSLYSAREPSTERLVYMSKKIDTEVGVQFFNANAIAGPVSLPQGTGGDFTVSFWLSFQSENRGVVFSYQEKRYPYNGLMCEVNMLGKVENRGMIQFKVDENTYIAATEYDALGNKVNYGDGVARHYALVKKDNLLSLYIDGKVSTQLGNISTLPTGLDLYFMGTTPTNLNVNGKIAHFMFNNYALQEQVIQVMCWFMVIAKIRGKITLDGFPTIADVRVFDNLTGQVITESKSDGDGWYDIMLNTSNYVDVMFFDKGNANVTYNTIGRMLVDQYEDVDWW